MPDKDALRRQILKQRTAQREQDAVSRRILSRIQSLPEWGRSQTVAYYVSCRSEVRTLAAIERSITARLRVVVPWCFNDNELRLVRLESIGELERGRFGIPVPNESVRDDVNRQIDAADVDLFLVPGVAFDRHGGRLGHGRGYYDRLLSNASNATRVGLAYDCQLVDAVPMNDHDVRMDIVVTENAVHRVSPRG